MPKKKRRREAQETKRPSSPRRGEAPAWQRFLIVGGAAGVLLVVAGLIGFGWYQTQIKPYNKTVLEVGDISYSLDHVARRMELYLQENSYFSAYLDALPSVVLGQLEDEAKLLQASDQIGVTVSDEEVAAEIRARGNLAADAMSDVYAQVWRQQVEESGLKPDEYQQMVRAAVYDEKVREHFRGEVPESEPQVRARWLVFEFEWQAEDAVERLNAGENLDSIANDPPREEPQETPQDGEDAAEVEPMEIEELGWIPRGTYAKELEDFMFSAEPGQTSEPILLGLQYYVVELVERDEDRKLEEEQKEQVANREMADWLESLDEVLEVKEDFTKEDQLRALERFVDVARAP